MTALEDRTASFCFVALLAASLANLCPASAAAQAGKAPTETVAEQALPSVVTLRIYDRSGSQLGLGSGFFLRDGRIATNRHVVEGASWIEVYDHDGKLLGTEPYAEAISSHLDLAILPALVDSAAEGLPLTGTPPRIGEAVWVIGSPEGLTGTVSTGVVSARRTLDGATLLQVSAPISPGSSGGPVLDSTGHVVGIAASILREGQNLNFAVPAEGLVALARSPAGHLDFPAAQSARTASTARSSTSDMSDTEARAMVDGADVVTIPARRDGSLADGDWTIRGKLIDFYKFSGSRGETVTISMTSSSFDTDVGILALSDSVGDDGWSDSDDDGGIGSNSLLTVTLPVTGIYLVMATSYDGGTGPYSLSLTEGSAAIADGRWRYIGIDSDSASWWWDSRSLDRSSPGYVRVWVRIVPPEPRSDAGISRYDQEKILYRLDCSRRRMSAGDYVYYFENRVVHSGSGDLSDWRNMPPGSVGEQITELLCRS